MVLFNKWEFNPITLSDLMCPVHLLLDDKDGLVPITHTGHMAERVNYHKLPDRGHF